MDTITFMIIGTVVATTLPTFVFILIRVGSMLNKSKPDGLWYTE